jgi:soluble lytic murein transglycosylase-like protein
MRWAVPIAIATATMLSAPADAFAAFPHLVGAGESLSSVAAADGLTVEQLAAANGLPAEASLIAGSTLMIPPQGASAAGPGVSIGEPTTTAAEHTQPTAGDGDADADDGGLGQQSNTMTGSSPVANTGSYVVQPGDTLSAIAARAGTRVADLAAANGVDPNAPLLSGTVLRMSGTPAEATQAGAPTGEAARAASSQPVGATAEGSSGAPPYPTAETVSPAEVGSIAAENGVPPSLAQAIAYQESGFNNSLTSSADARGVMQILPGTWNWINENLAGSTPLSSASAASNVRGGVLLLHSLLESTNGNPGLAAAGYFQGLPSVLQDGEAPETQQYVGNVLALKEQFGGG